LETSVLGVCFFAGASLYESGWALGVLGCCFYIFPLHVNGHSAPQYPGDAEIGPNTLHGKTCRTCTHAFEKGFILLSCECLACVHAMYIIERTYMCVCLCECVCTGFLHQHSQEQPFQRPPTTLLQFRRHAGSVCIRCRVWSHWQVRLKGLIRAEQLHVLACVLMQRQRVV
jgi:hypothetical protein